MANAADCLGNIGRNDKVIRNMARSVLFSLGVMRLTEKESAIVQLVTILAFSQ